MYRAAQTIPWFSVATVFEVLRKSATMAEGWTVIFAMAIVQKWPGVSWFLS
jgi:hypothetical protein